MDESEVRNMEEMCPAERVEARLEADACSKGFRDDDAFRCSLGSILQVYVEEKRNGVSS